MTNVYKNRHLVTKNERVQIPDCEYEPQKAVFPVFEATAETPEKSDVPVTDIPDTEELDTGQDNNAAPENTEIALEKVSENEAEEAPQVKIPTKEELEAIYEQSLKELASSVAQQAYFDALNKKKAELRDCITGVQSLMDELVIKHGQFIEEFTSELKYMATDIAEKMILEKINEDDLILQRLVLQTVNSVKNVEWLNVEISERLVGLVDVIKKELEKPEYNGRAFVFPVAGTDSVCRVVTNEGAVVSSIEAQAENLREEFRNFERQN